ncbi:MAG: hypothetical protein LC789_18375 [Actinobacteria bacterium]|nr:hypothetical protein [Actinomycetota bacterium]MCA1720001.1 hypothetical protein [Actinomycetota bacterium]
MRRRLTGVSGVSVDVKNNCIPAYAATPDDAVVLQDLAADYEPDLLDIQQGVVVVRSR